MTLVSFKQNSFKVQTKRSNRSKAKNNLFANNPIFFGTTFVLLGVSVLLSVFYCSWVARSAALQLDIQKVEETLLSLEEKNANLKIELANVKSLGKMPISIEERYQKELWPKYFSLAEDDFVVASSNLAQ